MSSNNRLANWRQALGDSRYALDSAWKAWRAGCLLLLTIYAVAAVVPAASAYSFGRLAGLVQEMASGSETAPSATFWVCLTFAVILTGAFCRIATTFVSAALGRKLELRISRDVLLHAATLDQSFFEDPDCQDQLARARNQPGKACYSFVVSTGQIITSVVQVISILTLLFWIEWISGLTLALLVLPTLMIHRSLTRQRYRAERNKTSQNRWASYYLKTSTAYLKTPTLKVYGLQPLMADRFGRCLEDLNEIDSDVARKQAAGQILESILIVGGLLVAAGWIIHRTAAGQLPFENFVTFWVAAAQFRSCLPSLLGHIGVALQMLMHIHDLNQFFDSRAMVPPDEGRSLERPAGDFRLENVTFHYRSHAVPALRNIDLHIRPGETLAIVGPNGAGKTTLAKLLLRLYHPSSGRIFVDGYDLSTLNLHAYHRHAAYVGHVPIKFEATAEESIAFGDWQKLAGDTGRVTQVAESLNLSDMINAMPHNLQTRLGCRFGEYDLSAGQWQKIAIARALARDPAVLIMDEPTANLDARYEFELLGALRRLAAGRTTVIISHRLSTLKMADRILVMEDGRIVDEGSHDELISRDGMYADLYRTQSPIAA